MKEATAPALQPEGPPQEGGAPFGDLDPVAATRAFGTLHEVILEIAAEHRLPVSAAEQRTLTFRVNEVIAEVVAGYVTAQHHELRRVAHELRNPLGSATMALTLLRARANLGEHARLAEMLERNLQRIERGLDEALVRRRPEEGGAVDLGR